MVLFGIAGALALGLGIYVGLGFPGLPGREDRVVPRRSARSQASRHFTPLDLMKRKERDRTRGFLSSRPERDDD